MARHLEGPALGSRGAGFGAGAFYNLPIEAANLQDWVVYFNDFLVPDDYDSTNDWTETQISGGGSASLVAATFPGILRLDCPANGDGPIVQPNSSNTALFGATPQAKTASQLESDFVFACRLRLADAGACSFFVGLAELNVTSTVFTTAGAVTSDNHAGFTQADPNTATASAINTTAAGTADGNAVTTSLSSELALADNEWVDLAVRTRGINRADFYYRRAGSGGPQNTDRLKWVHAATTTTGGTWDGAMIPTLALVGSGSGDDMDIDWIMWAGKRDLTVTS